MRADAGRQGLRFAGPAAPARSPLPIGLTGGILGIVALVVLLLQWPLAIAFARIFDGNSVLILMFWFFLTLTALVLSVTAIVLAARARLRGPWAIVGLVMGILTTLGSICAALMGLFL
ncbi:MAG: hypothetical protein U0790_08990 [Isosphaeraceae bacterium]